MKTKIRVRVVPIALLLFGGLVLGFQNGYKVAGYAAYSKRDYANALNYFSQAADHSGCGMVLLAMNQTDEALRHFQTAGDYKGIGLSLCKKRDYRTALQYFNTVQDNSGLGLAYLGMRDEAKARTCFTKANDWSGLGLLALAKKQYAEADRCFNSVQDFSGLGLSALKQKKFELATYYFQRARDSSGFALVELSRRSHRAAAAAFATINDQSGLGYTYMEMGAYSQAYRAFLNANDLNGLGDLYAIFRNFAKARAMFEADNNPVKVIQCFRNDYTLPDAGQKAVQYGEQAISQGRMAPECLLELAPIYYEMGRADLAIAACDRAATFPGFESEAHYGKGKVYFFMRDLGRASYEFSQVKADDMTGEERFKEAQAGLRTIATYQGLNVGAAQNY